MEETPHNLISLHAALPLEILYHVFAHFNHHQLTCISSVCKLWARLCKNPIYWKTINLRKTKDPVSILKKYCHSTEEITLSIEDPKQETLAIVNELCHHTLKKLVIYFEESPTRKLEYHFNPDSSSLITRMIITWLRKMKCFHLKWIELYNIPWEWKLPQAIFKKKIKLDHFSVNALPLQITSLQGYYTWREHLYHTQSSKEGIYSVIDQYETFLKGCSEGQARVLWPLVLLYNLVGDQSKSHHYFERVIPLETPQHKEAFLELEEKAFSKQICTNTIRPSNRCFYWFLCVDCNLSGFEGLCYSCAKTCHGSHFIIYKYFSYGAYCDCRLCHNENAMNSESSFQHKLGEENDSDDIFDEDDDSEYVSYEDFSYDEIETDPSF